MTELTCRHCHARVYPVPGHSGRYALTDRADGTDTLGSGSECPANERGHEVETDPDAPAVGQVRTWTDRINQPRQGRVQKVDGDDVELVTASGGVARVKASELDPVEPVPDPEQVAAAREAARAHAQGWLDLTLPARVEDTVTGAWDALRGLDPDGDSDEQKLAAARLVRDKVNDLIDRLDAHVARKQKGTEQ